MFKAKPIVAEVHQRVLLSTSSAVEGMQLGKRTSSALELLLDYKYLLPLIGELESLDTTTKLSPQSCQTIATSNAVPIIVQVIIDSNRSEPHKKVVYFALSILLNLAKVS
jgi:riboflavin transporter FmnP